MNNYKPLGTRILVVEDAPKEMTDGGIIIPDTAKQKSMTGTVSFVGNECKEVKSGDKVLYPQDTGSPLNLNGTEYLLMREEDIDLVF